jgi:hypothetical protein
MSIKPGGKYSTCTVKQGIQHTGLLNMQSTYSSVKKTHSTPEVGSRHHIFDNAAFFYIMEKRFNIVEKSYCF